MIKKLKDKIKKLNLKVEKMTVMDIGLVKLSVFFFTIIMVKFFPFILKLNYLLLIILVLACSAKPIYKTWFEKS